MKYDERQDTTIEALVNWCMNTEIHLTEARRIKIEAKRLPESRHIQRKWRNDLLRLISKMQKELEKAEPETFSNIGSIWPWFEITDFLKEIPDSY